MIYRLPILITIINAQLGTLANPYSTYPNGTFNPIFAAHPSNGCNAPSYTGFFSYVFSRWIFTISPAVTVVVFNPKIRIVVAGRLCSVPVTGICTHQIVGTAAAHVVQSTAARSQSTCASFGAVGSAAKRAADLFQAVSTPAQRP